MYPLYPSIFCVCMCVCRCVCVCVTVGVCVLSGIVTLKRQVAFFNSSNQIRFTQHKKKRRKEELY